MMSEVRKRAPGAWAYVVTGIFICLAVVMLVLGSVISDNDTSAMAFFAAAAVLAIFARIAQSEAQHAEMMSGD
jgi:hypothetical protein